MKIVSETTSVDQAADHFTSGAKRVVVHVVQHLKPGGIECLVLEMVKHSPDNSYIVSLEGNAAEALHHWSRLNDYADKLIFLNKYSGWRPSVVKQLKDIFKQLKVDVVHTHHIGPLLYAGTAARLAGIKHRIHTEHDAWHLRSIKRRILEAAALHIVRPKLVADANLVADNLDNARLFYPVSTIANGIDSEYFSANSKYDTDKKVAVKQLAISDFIIPAWARARANGFPLQVLGCAGRLVEEKGYQYLIEAMAALPEHVVLLIAGEGSQRAQLEALISENGLQQRIRLLGSINDMRPFYHAVDVFVMASLHEGLPLSPLEAQACGIPVVLTDVGACNEAICPDTGLLVPARDSAALCWAIRRQLKNVSLFSGCKSRHNPRQFVQQQRDIRQMIHAYRQLVQEQ